ncbi:MAG TPA: hypothetical protein VHU80_15235 [Polyangiaceae bacterium]|nr:hypothetical protein [Polyangiaceae bacterium]
MRRLGYVLLALLVCASLGGWSRVSRNRAFNAKRRARRMTALASVGNASLIGVQPRKTPAEPCDQDGDGIDDATEQTLAETYFPYFSLDPREDCGRHGVLFRASPHPDDPTKVALWYVVLFEHDCGLRGLGAHVGDDEVFGELVDPKIPAPAGILAIRAISHQNTTCERVTTCGTLPDCEPCDTRERAGKPYPVVYSSFHKHGNYAKGASCNAWLCDFHGCGTSAAPDQPAFVNAGEPAHPLARDLTAAGFITRQRGWTEPALLHFDPWSSEKFGGAGDVTDDLEDETFLLSPSSCRGENR